MHRIKIILWLLFFSPGIYAQKPAITISSNTGKIIKEDTVWEHTITLRDSLIIEMVKVPSGVFNMGSEKGFANERPVRRVRMNEYLASKFEVTQRLWNYVMKSNPSYFLNCMDCPVERVSYHDVLLFIDSLNRMTGLHFRLPAEAEWEYAAVAAKYGRNTEFSGSNKADEVAWYGKNSERQSHTVGQKMPNALGIFDMSGNVYEWTQDWMGRYKENDKVQPSGPLKGRYKVIRGGCWYDTGEGCRVKCRVEMKPDEKNGCTGFRLFHDYPLPVR